METRVGAAAARRGQPRRRPALAGRAATIRGLARLVIATLALGACGGGEAGGETVEDAAADSPGVVVLDTGPAEVDAGPDVAQVCKPGELFCANVDERARCDEDGLGYKSVGFCNPPRACDAETALCAPVVCEADLGLCADLVTVATCSHSGTTWSVGQSCEGQTSCDGGMTCSPWVCEPGSHRCNEAGNVERCQDDGLARRLLYGCDESVGSCIGCADQKTSLSCAGVAAGEAPVPQPCPFGGVCYPAAGCIQVACPGMLAGCDDGTSDPDGCAAVADCIPLPPQSLGEASTHPGETGLTVAFSAGTGATGQFITLAPVLSPVSGEFLADLLPRVEVGGTLVGHLALTEDGQPRELSCAGLKASPEARTDLVFVVDITGSMQPSIDAVKDGIQDLATFLATAGLDMRYGAVGFLDLPTTPDNGVFLPLTDDVETFRTFIANLEADGGDDLPENALDHVALAMDTMGWRTGSPRVMVLVTDAPMHIKEDSSGFTQTDFYELVARLKRRAVVHTVSPPLSETSPCHEQVYPNPRLLSCVTGGTATPLSGFSAPKIQEAFFARALAETTHCSFESSDPSKPHDLELTLTFVQQGTTLTGSSLLEQVLYSGP